eukprot:gene31522-6705_t
MGAKKCAALLLSRDILFATIVDEGGSILVDGVRPLVKNHPIAVVSTSEKVPTIMELSFSALGGHASWPPTDGSDLPSQMASFIARLKSHPPAPDLRAPVTHFLKGLVPYTNSFLRVVMWHCHAWPWRQILTQALIRSSRETASMVRTSVAVTRISAGVADNVLPQQGTITLNLRSFYVVGPQNRFVPYALVKTNKDLQFLKVLPLPSTLHRPQQQTRTFSSSRCSLCLRRFIDLNDKQGPSVPQGAPSASVASSTSTTNKDLQFLKTHKVPELLLLLPHSDISRETLIEYIEKTIAEIKVYVSRETLIEYIEKTIAESKVTAEISSIKPVLESNIPTNRGASVASPTSPYFLAVKQSLQEIWRFGDDNKVRLGVRVLVRGSKGEPIRGPQWQAPQAPATWESNKPCKLTALQVRSTTGRTSCTIGSQHYRSLSHMGVMRICTDALNKTAKDISRIHGTNKTAKDISRMLGTNKTAKDISRMLGTNKIAKDILRIHGTNKTAKDISRIHRTNKTAKDISLFLSLLEPSLFHPAVPTQPVPTSRFLPSLCLPAVFLPSIALTQPVPLPSLWPTQPVPTSLFPTQPFLPSLLPTQPALPTCSYHGVFLPALFPTQPFLPTGSDPARFLLPSLFPPLPSLFLPSLFLPSLFLPSLFLPSLFLPSLFLPSLFLPSMFLPSMFLPSMFLPSMLGWFL